MRYGCLVSVENSFPGGATEGHTERMDTTIAGIVVTVTLIVVGVVAVVRHLIAARLRRRFAADRDDTQRAGASDAPTASDAALRAGGSTAWMRPGGF